MKVLLFFSLCLLSVSLFGQVTTNGKISGLKEAGVHILYINALGEPEVIDSIKVLNDSFSFELANPVTQIYQVSSKTHPLGFSFWPGDSVMYVEGKIEDIQITAENRHFSRYMTDLSIKGSKLQTENNRFFSSIKPELDSLEKWKKNGKLNIALVGETSDIDKMRISIADKARSYIKENLDSELSPFILFFFGSSQYLPATESRFLKTLFTNKVKSSVYYGWILNNKD